MPLPPTVSTSHPRSPAEAISDEPAMALFSSTLRTCFFSLVFIPWLQNKGFAWSKNKGFETPVRSTNMFVDACAFPNTML
jgi:hypothetical protein